MTYFATICSTKTIQANLKVSEVLITYITNWGEVRVMLHIRAGHSNNCQITLELFGHDIFCNNWRHKNNVTSNLEVSEVLITYVTNRRRATVMLHIGGGHCNNCKIILKLFGYDIFCNNLEHRNNFKEILRYQGY